MPLTEQQAADQAISSLDSLTPDQQSAQQALHQILHSPESSTPFLDIHQLFAHFNTLYFLSLLLPKVEVSWSPRLTLCAGICELCKDAEGKYKRIRLKLSEPLLQYRPRSDTVSILLHESIHAYFFATSSHTRSDDPSGHGTGFQALASAINHHGLTALQLDFDINIYHSFHDEVDSFRTHVWQCDGPCRKVPPYFGIVKRSMNRAPGKSDGWWVRHEEECGGTWVKIGEPEVSKRKVERMSVKERAGMQRNKISGWLAVGKGGCVSSGKEKENKEEKDVAIVDDEEDSNQVSAATNSISTPKRSNRRLSAPEEGRTADMQTVIDEPPAKRSLISCPICDVSIEEKQINGHLDTVHSL